MFILEMYGDSRCFLSTSKLAITFKGVLKHNIIRIGLSLSKNWKALSIKVVLNPARKKKFKSPTKLNLEI